MTVDKEKGDSRPKDLPTHNFVDPLKMPNSSKDDNKSEGPVVNLSLIQVGPISSNPSMDKIPSAQGIS